MRLGSRIVVVFLAALCFTTAMMIVTLEQSHPQFFAPRSLTRDVSETQVKETENCLSHDMVYWTSEDRMESPYAVSGPPKQRYVSFEYDQGGWNNIRMGMECVLAFALGTNRTVILPPASRLYLLNNHPGKTTHSFLDFFDLGAIETKFPGTLIEFEDFVKREGPGLGKVPRDGCDVGCAKTYMRSVAKLKPLDAGAQCLVFQNSSQPSELDERVRGLCGTRKVERYYPPADDNDLVVHIPMMESSRLLAHFYAFVMFPDTRFDRYVKRWMRNHMHYREEIFCAAAPIVHALKNESGGTFNAIHIRRNDFQFTEAWMEIPDIAELMKDVLPAGSTLYIASDEKNHDLFRAPFANYHIKFLDDFLKQGYLKGVNPNLYGMIEQIIASHADRFVGTWWSTFTGYINRMRGYWGTDTRSWYYPKHWKDEMQTFHSPDASGWWREWPVAWRDIDRQ